VVITKVTTIDFLPPSTLTTGEQDCAYPLSCSPVLLVGVLLAASLPSPCSTTCDLGMAETSSDFAPSGGALLDSLVG
jgi:hypothetical protein